jgi:hypothetical protein
VDEGQENLGVQAVGARRLHELLDV